MLTGSSHRLLIVPQGGGLLFRDSCAADISFDFYGKAGGKGCQEQESDHLFPVHSWRPLREAAPWGQCTCV